MIIWFWLVWLGGFLLLLRYVLDRAEMRGYERGFQAGSQEGRTQSYVAGYRAADNWWIEADEQVHAEQKRIGT